MDFLNRFDELVSRQITLGSDNTIDLQPAPAYRRLFESASNYLTLALSTPEFEGDLSGFLASRFNENKTKYDSIIDEYYNQTHIGGSSLHHNLDGSHTWDGAVNALQEAFPEESAVGSAYHAFVHLLRDVTTPSGINPFLSPSEFDQQKEILVESFHIPKSVANDLLNINATELCATAVATVGILLNFDEREMNRYGQYVSRLSLSSYIAGNPALLLLTTVLLGRICFQLWKGDSAAGLIDGGLQGGLSAATFFYAASLFSGQIFIGLVVGAAACFAVNWSYQLASSALRNDLDSMLEAQFSSYRSYYKVIG